jgi:hypothetical protein
LSHHYVSHPNFLRSRVGTGWDGFDWSNLFLEAGSGLGMSGPSYLLQSTHCNSVIAYSLINILVLIQAGLIHNYYVSSTLVNMKLKNARLLGKLTMSFY